MFCKHLIRHICFKCHFTFSFLLLWGILRWSQVKLFTHWRRMNELDTDVALTTDHPSTMWLSPSHNNMSLFFRGGFLPLLTLRQKHAASQQRKKKKSALMFADNIQLTASAAALSASRCIPVYSSRRASCAGCNIWWLSQDGSVVPGN